MRCDEMREYLFAYLDNELDVPVSIELQRHVETCHQCAREVEIEWAIKGKLTEVLSRESVDVESDERTLQRLLEHEQTRWPSVRWRKRRFVMRMAAAVGIVALAGIWFGVRGLTSRADISPLAKLLVDDFEHFVEEGRPVQIASSDRAAVADWLRVKTTFDVQLPDVQAPRFLLVGGRKCKISGQPAAFAVFELDGALASLVAVDAGHFDLDGMKRCEREGHVYWVDRYEGHTVVAWQRGELIYAAVSTLPEDRLLALMNNSER